MKIGVLSDTHDEVHAAQRALKTLDGLGVDLIIHCGDVGQNVVPLFNGLKAHFVRGNMDDPETFGKLIDDPGHTFHDEIGSLEVEGRRIAFLHGNDVKLLHHTVHCGHFDLVCHGHTHAFAMANQGSTLVLNPGAVSRSSQPSLAVVELPSLEVRQIPL